MSPFPDKTAREAHQRANLLQSLMLMAGAGAAPTLAAAILWGLPGALAAIALLSLMYAAAPRLPAGLTMALYRAAHVPRDESQLASLVDVLAYRAELKERPDLYVVPSLTISAFSAGNASRAAIALTEGLLRRLTLREIAGVVAHEMAHIRSQDLLVFGLADLLTRLLQLSTYAAVGMALLNVLAILVRADTIPWPAILLLYLAQPIASLVQLALPREREFEADGAAAALTGDAEGLHSALDRLEDNTGRAWEDFMLPVPARSVPYPSLLRSHPPAEDRAKRLASLGDIPGLEPLVIVEQPMMSLVGYGPGEMRPRYRWPGLWF